MGSASVDPPKPWIETPTILSAPLSRAAGWSVKFTNMGSV